MSQCHGRKENETFRLSLLTTDANQFRLRCPKKPYSLEIQFPIFLPCANPIFREVMKQETVAYYNRYNVE